MCTDPYAAESEIAIHKDGDKLIADYRYSYEGGRDRFYGNELLFRAEPAYADCENGEWSYAFSKSFEDDPEKILTLTDEDTLVIYDVYETDKEELGDGYYFYKSETKATYLRKDSPKLDDLDDLRYFETVTVSNAENLLNSIKNNTRIILESGRYDFTDIPSKAIQNENISYGFEGYTVSNVSNLCIEAAERADVLICVANPYAPVLSFQNGMNLTLRGLTVGHDVEPGMCSGSVVYFSGANGIHIEECRLYGSGTYGVEAEYCSDMDVEDTLIYDCTYGLVSMASVSDVLFKGCEMCDSSEFSMFDIRGSYGVLFEDCNIHNNDSSYAYNGVFVSLGDEYGDVTFRNCEFKDNTYQKFSDYSVNLEKCTVNDHVVRGE